MKTIVVLILLIPLSVLSQEEEKILVEYIWPEDEKVNVRTILVRENEEGKKRIFAGTSRKCLWISDDAGENWVQREWEHGLTAGLGNIFDLAVTPSGRILAGTFGGLFASDDDGESWRYIFNKTGIVALAVVSGKIFAGGYGIWVSEDDGETWEIVADRDVLAVNISTIIETPSGTILAGNESGSADTTTFGGIIRSTDGGKTWEFSNQGLTGWGKNIRELATWPFGFVGEVYLASADGGMWKSKNDGVSWSRLEVGNIRSHAVGAFNPLGVFLGFAWVPTLWHSYTGDRNWEPVPGFDNKENRLVVLSLAQLSSNQILVGTHNGLFLVTWKKMYYPPLAFNLLQPVEGDTLKLITPSEPVEFVWEASLDSEGNDIEYELTVWGYNFQRTVEGIEDTIIHLNIMDDLTIASEYHWTVTSTNGVYQTRSDTLTFYTSDEITGIDIVERETPEDFHLNQNYPNPFNPGTTIEFSLPEKTVVKLTVVNVLGQEIAMLVNGEKIAGIHRVMWDASGHPSGVYFYRLETGSYVSNRKMVYMR